MNAKLLSASLLLVAIQAPGCAPAAIAGETQSLPQVRAVLHVFDCQARALPNQREVGEWTGQQNFAQVYDTRGKLMAEVSRACRKAGIEQVQLVRARSTDPGRIEHAVAQVELPNR